MKNLFTDIELNQCANIVAEPETCQAAEVQLSYKRVCRNFPKMTSSEAVYSMKDTIYPEGAIDYKEYFFVLLVNHSGNLLGWHKVSEGGLSCCPVDVKIVMQAAILSCASSLILIHNHPSGTLRPSMEDDKLTNKIKEAAKLFDIRVNDHVIFTEEGYYSYNDNGKI